MVNQVWGIMKDSENADSKFERCHSGSETYRALKAIEHRFTDEFNKLTFDLMVENFIRFEMERPGMLSDRDFTKLKDTWHFVAEELKVLYDYPYNMNVFQNNHPFSGAASVEGKKKLGIT